MANSNKTEYPESPFFGGEYLRDCEVGKGRNETDKSPFGGVRRSEVNLILSEPKKIVAKTVSGISFARQLERNAGRDREDQRGE